MLSEVHLGTGFDHVLVARGQIPFFAAVDHYEQVDEREAVKIVIETILCSQKGPNWELLRFLKIDQHPQNIHPRNLRDLIGHQLRHLGHELYRRVRAPVKFDFAPAQAAPALADTVTVRPSAYVIVEVVSKAERPQPGVRIELTAPDGSVNTLITDARGQASLRGIDPGSCTIVLPTIDQSRWTAGGSQGQLLRKEPARTHVVKPGECLTQLADANGIADWHKIWDHPDNAALKAKRKSPNVLLPGDQLVLPGIDVAQIKRPTDATHRITVDVDAAEVELVLVFRDHQGAALKDEPYELTFKHEGKAEKRAGQLSGTGELREKVPAALMSTTLAFPARKETCTLALGHLDPARDEASTPIEAGAIARLAALGFMARRKEDERRGDVRAATRTFQKQVMGHREPTGELDSETCSKLEDTYGA